MFSTATRDRKDEEEKHESAVFDADEPELGRYEQDEQQEHLAKASRLPQFGLRLLDFLNGCPAALTRRFRGVPGTLSFVVVPASSLLWEFALPETSANIATSLMSGTPSSTNPRDFLCAILIPSNGCSLYRRA